MDLVRRQDGAVARCANARAHAYAALRHGRFRRLTLLSDGQWAGDFSPPRSYGSAVSIGADLRDENSVQQRRVERRAKGMCAQEQARLLLSAAARILWLACDGRRGTIESSPRRDQR